MKQIPPERLAFIHGIIDSHERVDQRCEAIRSLQDPFELLELAQYYNWDDGMHVPHAIKDHPVCDLGLALHLFELAEGIVWLTEESNWEYQEEWADFCRTLADRINTDYYAPNVIPFESELTKVQQYKARKAGVPAVFFACNATNQ